MACLACSVWLHFMTSDLLFWHRLRTELTFAWHCDSKILLLVGDHQINRGHIFFCPSHIVLLSLKLLSTAHWSFKANRFYQLKMTYIVSFKIWLWSVIKSVGLCWIFIAHILDFLRNHTNIFFFVILCSVRFAFSVMLTWTWVLPFP